MEPLPLSHLLYSILLQIPCFKYLGLPTMPIFPASATLAWKAGALLSASPPPLCSATRGPQKIVRDSCAPACLPTDEGSMCPHSFERDHGRRVRGSCACAEAWGQGGHLGEFRSSSPPMEAVVLSGSREGLTDPNRMRVEWIGHGESVRDLERQYVPTFFPRPNHSPSGVPGLTGLVPQSVSSPSRNIPSTRSASRLRSSSLERLCSPGVSSRSCCTGNGPSLFSPPPS